MTLSEEQRLIRRINELSTESLDGAIERGQILKKLGLDWHEYESKKIGISFHTGYRLIALVDHPRMKRKDWEKPALWTVCYELLQMSDKLFESMLAAGFVNHHTTRRQARDFIKIHRRNLKPIDSNLSTQRVNNRMNLAGQIYHEDCLEGMKRIDDGTVDMILCDLPYGTTECDWDSVIPTVPLWEQYKRIIKTNGAIVLTASQPFSTTLIVSNMKWFKYAWVWEKNHPTGHVHANNNPMKIHEDVLVFSSGTTNHASQSKNRMPYNPQGLVRVDLQGHNSSRSQVVFGMRPSHKKHFVQAWSNYPTSVLHFAGENHTGRIHPTQKPVALFEYLIRTYTNPGELVLDNCLGSGTTAIACMNSDRRFVGFELNEEYFKAAQDRINNHVVEDKKPDLLAPMFEEVS